MNPKANTYEISSQAISNLETWQQIFKNLSPRILARWTGDLKFLHNLDGCRKAVHGWIYLLEEYDVSDLETISKMITDLSWPKEQDVIGVVTINSSLNASPLYLLEDSYILCNNQKGFRAGNSHLAARTDWENIKKMIELRVIEIENSVLAPTL